MDAIGPFRWLVYQQDYLWFLVALGWALLLIAWWRLGRPARMFLWVPWAAVAGFLTAALEVSQMVTPVEVQPSIAPWLAWDLALGGCYALAATGCWWVVAAQRKKNRSRLAGLVLASTALLVAVLRYAYPEPGAWVIAGLLSAGSAAVAAGRMRGERVALAAWALSVWFGTAGPLAERFKEPHRFSEISNFGPWAAACGLVAIIVIVLDLYRITQAGKITDEGDPEEWRQLVRSLVLWLFAGVFVAAIMGRWARANFERNLQSRTLVSAGLIDRQKLQTILGKEFHFDKISRGRTHSDGREIPFATSRYLGSGILGPIATHLTDIELANPDVRWAAIITMRDGWMAALCYSTRLPGNASDVGVFGRPTREIWRAWAEHSADVLGPVDFYYGAVVQARAPLIGLQGQMLGWLALDLNVEHWVAAQVQARLLAFVIVALGGALLVVNWRQRQRERQREAAQRDADAAAAANQLKSAFLAKVSHELRTPIQSLLGYSELLRQRVADDSKASAWLGSLRQQGELMTRLVNDLIDLGAVEAGAFQLSPKAVEPADVVAQTAESFRPRAEAKGLNFACFVDPSIPPWVLTDGERLRQIVTNLLSNAVKFTDCGGVTLSARSEPGNKGTADIILVVRDTGPGIPSAAQARLFSAFSRLEATATKEGSGLGLALSAALCRAMGGNLTVQSDGATGCSFIATIRTQTTKGPVNTRIETPAAALRGHRVLVVDDNPLVRELFVAFLTEQGALCAAAGNGSEALAQAATDAFDVVVLDLALPDTDGAEVARRLRAEDGRGRALRLVGVSAHAGAADRARALAAGMDVFLTKPVPLGDLAAAVAGSASGPETDTLPFRTGEALRERLTRQFRNELPDQRVALAEAVTNRDWQRVRVMAHHLKNSAVVVRDDELFDTCAGLEQAAGSANGPTALAFWTRCERVLDRWAAPADAPFSPSAA